MCSLTRAFAAHKVLTSMKTHLYTRGSRNFRQGGGGVQVSLTKKALTTFFYFYFLVLSLFYRRQVVNLKEIYHFSRFQRGSNIFQGGPTFPGGWGSNCLFPIETYITCDFQGGGGSGPPVPPLWIRTCSISTKGYYLFMYVIALLLVKNPDQNSNCLTP